MKLAQPMADKVIRELKRLQPFPVYLADTQGIVVASSEAQLLGKWRPEAAAQLEQSHRRLDPTTGSKYLAHPEVERGARCLFVKNRLAGAVGLVGPTEQVHPYIELAAALAELILDREADVRQESVRNAAGTQVLKRLISAHMDRLKLEEALAYHKIDPLTPRTIVLFRFYPLAKERGPKLETLERSDSAIFRNAVGSMLSTLSSRFTFQEDLILPDPEQNLAFVLCADRSHDLSINETRLMQLCQVVVEDAAANYSIVCRALIGKRCMALEDYDDQCHQTLQGYETASQLFPQLSTLLGNSIVLGNVVAGIPEPVKQNILENVFGRLFKISQKDMYLTTLEAYFRQNMNSSTTAEQLFIHRNTLQHRFKKIEELTGYGLYRTEDVLTLRLACLILRSMGD